jgi:response regulator RpfG family c-di-GMP phosphodiesterase
MKLPTNAGVVRADIYKGGDQVMPQHPSIRVLVIDDDRPLCEMLRVALELAGIEVAEAHHVIQAERLLAEAVPDAVVLDIGLPGIDGVFYCERLRESPRTKSIPIVAISGSEDAGHQAVAAGANAFLHKPLDPVHLLATVEGLVGRTPLEHHEAGMAGELRRLIDIGQRQHDLLASAYRQTLEALSDALESRDFGTSAHSHRVTSYATRLTLEVAPSLLDDPTLEWGFLLHDVGKIGIPDRVLLKQGVLTKPERQCIQKHTLIGERLVGHVPLLQGAGLDVIRSHHEHWNGAGYPHGTAAEETPIAARIFAAADALDAMTDQRPYRSPLSWDDALTELTNKRGSQFDPFVIDAIAACEDDLRQTYLNKKPVLVTA